MKEWRTVLFIALVFLLAISSAFGGASVTMAAAPAPKEPEVKISEELLKPADPNETVRIIVELEKAPAIDSATKKGLLYKAMPDDTKESLEAAIAANQKATQAAIDKVAPSTTYLESFTTVFNGFSAEVEAKQIEKIVEQKGIKAIYKATEYKRPDIKPEMIHSKELVQAQQVWNDYGLRGEGTVVGIIDTGIDPSHKDMILTDNAKGELTKAEVDALLADKSLRSGKFFTEKVPFGYNYMDGNDEIRDIGPDATMHGMHVAGTVAANGNEENNGVKGIAPEAQLLALKVFSNDPLSPSTYGDIYIKAIDDAIKLGADVVNMSIGATAGFVDSSDPEQLAVERATDNGILVSVSAGNSNMLGAGFAPPLAANQDYGLTGSPSVAYDSFGVASFENTMITAKSFLKKVNGADAGRSIYFMSNKVDPAELPEDAYAVVDAGLGKPEEFEGKDFVNKFALISRGEITFAQKALNAQAAGAVGVIIYNNTTGVIGMAGDPAIRIPFLSILQSDGLEMKAALDAGSELTVSFDGEYLEVPSPTAGKMSDFTSWGPTPNLDFKPEITAPGGNIFSTLNNDQYGLMSGTSMAAPHVSGGAALLFQRLQDELKVDGVDRVQYAKNLMMNSANPVEFAEGQFVSPRRQGSGLMQLHDALSTDFMVTDKATHEAKVALKEINNDQFSFALVAENFSDSSATFNVAVNVQVDKVMNAGGNRFVTNPNTLGSENITGAVNISAPQAITIPANGQVEIPVTVNMSAISGQLRTALTNGFFVDGFVTLTDSKEEATGNSKLVVPYFGFNGGWDDANIFDKFAWDPMTYYGTTVLVNNQNAIMKGGTHEPKYVPEKFAFSPNGDGVWDQIFPYFSLLRNAKELEVNVLDAEGKKLRTIRSDKKLMKNYSPLAPYVADQAYGWNGQVLGKQVEDGKYQIQLRAVIDFPDAQWQSIEFPILVDTVAPQAQAAYNADTTTVEVASFTDTEGGAGPDRWEVFLNGTELTEDAATPADESLAPATRNFKLPSPIKTGDELVAIFYDVAGNRQQVELTKAPATVTTSEPTIYIDAPLNLSIHNKEKIIVSGRVEDDTKVASVTVNGAPASQFDGRNFTHTLTLVDGVRDIDVAAVDDSGNDIQIRRKVFVDTTPAELTLLDVPKSIPANQNEAEITFNIKDNFDEIRVYVYDSEIYAHKISTPYEVKNFNEKVTAKIPVLEGGVNQFKLIATDLAGNPTEVEFSIRKETEKN
ncbi:S8 family serine peptidase [Planococcus shixiaomingii]|uniref:S8 family serine peptidase n=1 Tax=Planococcus shixiaomingii TaxID=3058393 RepID=UPI0026081DE9|nr:S8 family serine peptidase [Planococcus sp. N022]WKA54031.1 S8 family serine peptidase [Planococcus sp. N022]